MKISERIKSARIAKGMTQLELAVACGWDTQGRISNYENEVREPSLSNIKKIENVLKVKLLTDDFSSKERTFEQLPIISWDLLSAGDDFKNIVTDEMISVYDPPQQGFALKIIDDSMQPMLPIDHYVIIDTDIENNDLKDGDIVLIKTDFSISIRQLETSKTLLKPLNPQWPIQNNSGKVLGKAVQCYLPKIINKR